MSSPRKKPVVLRKLGGMEGHLAAMYAMDLYHSTIVTCHYTIPADLVDPQHQERLAQVWEMAIARVGLAHPLMQVGLINLASKKPCFVRLNTVDLSNHIEWCIVMEEQDYAAIRKKTMLEQLDKPFLSPEAVPGWRVVILRNLKDVLRNDLEVMFVFNHPVLDGTGAKIFHQDLVRSLNVSTSAGGPILDNHTFKTNVKTRKDIPPSQHHALDFSNTLSYTASTILHELAPTKVIHTLSPSTKALSANFKGWPAVTPLNPKGDRASKPLKTHFTTLSIDAVTVDRVLTACRAHRTTLTGLLHAICFVSLVQQIPESQTGTVMKSSTALNLRRHLPANRSKEHPLHDPERVVANIVSKMTHVFGGGGGGGGEQAELLDKIRNLSIRDPDAAEKQNELDKILWTTAARVRTELKDRVDRGTSNEPAGLMHLVDDWRGYFRGLIKKPRETAWQVTNIGVLDGGSGGSGELDGARDAQWRIRKAYFTLSAEVSGPGLVVGCVTVRGGELCVDISWERGIIEDAVGERLGADIEGWLRRIGKV